MQRTQVMLESEQHRLLGAEARRQGTSLAAVIRQLVDEHFSLSPDQNTYPLEAVKGIGSGTGERVGREHNRHLYGSAD